MPDEGKCLNFKSLSFLIKFWHKLGRVLWYFCRFSYIANCLTSWLIDLSRGLNSGFGNLKFSLLDSLGSEESCLVFHDTTVQNSKFLFKRLCPLISHSLPSLLVTHSLESQTYHPVQGITEVSVQGVTRFLNNDWLWHFSGTFFPNLPYLIMNLKKFMCNTLSL